MQKHEQWLYKNKEALKKVKEGIKAAQQRKFVSAPDFNKDAKSNTSN